MDTTTAAAQLLGMCPALGITHLFTNLGSDHPAFIEALAGLHARGLPMPRVIVCPHEMSALSAAHGYAMVTRQAQLVLVHVDVGTQNLGCSVHNAARGRVPAIIVAGLSPVSDRPGARGARGEFIHWTQDAPRQREVVEQYMKWSYELRAPAMLDRALLRALQVATSAPQGPVYLTGAREVWEGMATTPPDAPVDWAPARLGPLPADFVGTLRDALQASRAPLLITGYLGRDPRAVPLLAELSDRVGIAVCEPSPQYLNFPGDHPHHVGYRRNTAVDAADLIMLVDVDVPWITTKVAPAPGIPVFHIDADPLKQDLGYWHYPARHTAQADSRLALAQLLEALGPQEVPGRAGRVAWINSVRATPAPRPPQGEAISAQELTEAVRGILGEHSVVIFEEPSGTELIPDILRLRRPGSFYASGGSGLGWGINAALGVRLADPHAEVISLVGDGCYLFGVPSSAYWVGRAYGVPQLTVIYNNGGWHSPKLSTLAVHPDGMARQQDAFWVTIGAGAQLAQIAAAAGDVLALTVTRREGLGDALVQGIAAVRAGRSAVLDVHIAPVSGQLLG